MFLGLQKVIEQRAFLQLITGDAGLLDTIIALFGQQSEDTIKTMEGALAAQDWQAMQRAVHDLKNIGRSVASPRLIQQSQELDRLAIERQLVQLQKAISRTERLLARASRELHHIRRKLP